MSGELPDGWHEWVSPQGVSHAVPPRGPCATCGRGRHLALAPGDWVFDTWTKQRAQVVAGAQAEGYVTVALGDVLVAVRHEHVRPV